MRLTITALAVCVAAISAQSNPSDGTVGSADPRFAAARATIQRLMESEKLPSVSVALVKNGELLWQEAFGFANKERQVRATPATAYSLASISKPITATGLMRLVDQKKVDLDRPANEYLGKGKLSAPGGGDASGATVRRVLSHTAGLPLHYQFFYAGLPYAEPPVDDTITRYGILVNPPGAVFAYSNLGYGILDQIIERASGRRYADYMRDEVFRPLGMRQASVHLAGRKPAEYAERYDAEGKPIPYYDFDHDGGSAVYASAQDLVKFGAFHLGVTLADQRRVLEDTTRAAMVDVQTPPSSPTKYGLGWFVGDDRGVRRVWHTGSMPGVATVLNLYPDEKIITVVLSNTSNTRAVTQMAAAVTGSLLPNLAEPLPPPAPQIDPASRLRPEHVGQWSGVVRTWQGDVPLALRVEADGDIKVRLGAGLWALLNQATWSDQRLIGRFAGTLPTPDARRHPHVIALDLWLRDGKFSGQATAQTTDPPVYFALTSYVSITKRPAESQ